MEELQFLARDAKRAQGIFVDRGDVRETISLFATPGALVIDVRRLRIGEDGTVDPQPLNAVTVTLNPAYADTLATSLTELAAVIRDQQNKERE